MDHEAGRSNKPPQEALEMKEDAREYTHDTMLIFPCCIRDVVLRVCKKINNFQNQMLIQIDKIKNTVWLSPLCFGISTKRYKH